MICHFKSSNLEWTRLYFKFSHFESPPIRTIDYISNSRTLSLVQLSQSDLKYYFLFQVIFQRLRGHNLQCKRQQHWVHLQEIQRKLQLQVSALKIICRTSFNCEIVCKNLDGSLQKYDFFVEYRRKDIFKQGVQQCKYIILQ